jgi:hypothetical protein
MLWRHAIGMLIRLRLVERRRLLSRRRTRHREMPRVLLRGHGIRRLGLRRRVRRVRKRRVIWCGRWRVRRESLTFRGGDAAAHVHVRRHGCGRLLVRLRRKRALLLVLVQILRLDGRRVLAILLLRRRVLLVVLVRVGHGGQLLPQEGVRRLESFIGASSGNDSFLHGRFGDDLGMFGQLQLSAGGWARRYLCMSRSKEKARSRMTPAQTRSWQSRATKRTRNGREVNHFPSFIVSHLAAAF